MTYPIDSLLAQPIIGFQQTADLVTDLRIFPSPASAKVTVTMGGSYNLPIEAAIYTLKGQLLRRAVIPAGRNIHHQFEVAALPAGQYLLKVKSGKKTGTGRFIKQ
jgi:Secretion system C-terminal sorting domain